MLVIFPILFYLLNTAQFSAGGEVYPDAGKVIYLVKISWHTGMIFRTDQIDTTIWKPSDDFKNYAYIDVGWGDKDFYQAPGFDLDLAVKALFTETKSTLRIGGINSIREYLNSTDYTEKLFLNNDEYENLCRFIQRTYELINGKPQVLSRHSGGAVVFYMAKGNYNCFNTCNTWAASALQYAGFNIDNHIILSEQLFRELVKYGEMIKSPK